MNGSIGISLNDSEYSNAAHFVTDVSECLVSDREVLAI